MTITTHKNILPIRLFGLFFLVMGMFALALEEPFSSGRCVALLLVSYFFWGMSFSTVIKSDSIQKNKGWFFPAFKTEYTELKRIELKTSYIYQHGYGAHSHYALYVGIVHGAHNEFIDLSSGAGKIVDGEQHAKWVRKLVQTTGLPVTITDEFQTQFNNQFGYEFSY